MRNKIKTETAKIRQTFENILRVYMWDQKSTKKSWTKFCTYTYWNVAYVYVCTRTSVWVTLLVFLLLLLKFVLRRSWCTYIHSNRPLVFYLKSSILWCEVVVVWRLLRIFLFHRYSRSFRVLFDEKVNELSCIAEFLELFFWAFSMLCACCVSFGDMWLCCVERVYTS